MLEVFNSKVSGFALTAEWLYVVMQEIADAFHKSNFKRENRTFASRLKVGDWKACPFKNRVSDIFKIKTNWKI